MAFAEGKQSRNVQPAQDTSDSAPTDEHGTVIYMDLKTYLKPDRNGHRHAFAIMDHYSNNDQDFLMQT
ncbi:Copiatype Polyprotein [Phytophthora palmivora]|uniref:Copiatype Polyprotein n=1 Tax=Phytophthora palmivora TaxID=4796 RepID=A0A2P4XB21_9STRA|nr:Copiatype Polyprotein [Phytophthora palmivora]